MKALSCFATLILFLASFSPAKSQEEPETKKNILLFIDGHKFETYFNIEEFKKGFKLRLSEPDYTIKQFNLNWSSTDDMINELLLQDSIVHPKGKDYSFEKAAETFFIDNILVEKEGKLFRIPAQTFRLAEPAAYKNIYDTLAKNKAYIKGNSRGEFFVPSSLFKKKFQLGLWDSSYQIISFDILFIIGKEEKEVVFHFTGDCIDTVTDDFRQAVSRLNDNDMIFFSNIKAKYSKDGKIYTIPQLMVVKRGE